jgi:cysteine synthase
MMSSFASLLRGTRSATMSSAAGVSKLKAASLAATSSSCWVILQGVGRRDLNVASRPSDLIGGTPLLDLGKILEQAGVSNRSKLYGKLESLGPCSSVKDRLGRSMIDQAEKEGKITPGETVLVEPTSGNTGIALAFIARERGYRCILTMPETMSVERRMMLLALGCEVVLTPKETAVPGALAKAHEILTQLDGKGYMLQQFENPANPKVHRETVRFFPFHKSESFAACPPSFVFCLSSADRSRDLA